MGFPIFELPIHLIFQILTKLPLKTLYHCTLVCKSFRTFIKDPYFCELHHARAPTFFFIQRRLTDGQLGPHSMLHSINSSPQLAASDPDLSNSYGCDQFLVNQTVAKAFIRDYDLVLVNSINGYLCFHYASQILPCYQVWDPMTGYNFYLPNPISSQFGYTYLGFSAFGLGSMSNKYKIIRLISKLDNFLAVEVHELCSKSWRIIDSRIPFSKNPIKSFDPFVNGAVHWITYSYKPSEIICSFDLDEENFKYVVPPSHFNTEFGKKISWINVGAFNGCLCLCYVCEGDDFEVWVMKEYGIEESWTKKFGIDIKSYCGLKLGREHRPIGFTREGDMWLNCESCSLVSYCPTKGSFRDVGLHGNGAKIEAIPYVPNIFPLRDVFQMERNLMEEDTNC